MDVVKDIVGFVKDKVVDIVGIVKDKLVEGVVVVYEIGYLYLDMVKEKLNEYIK